MNIRKNAWNDGGAWANEDLAWYARAVGKMQEFPLNDRRSWRYWAAIHGHGIHERLPDFANKEDLPKWSDYTYESQAGLTPYYSNKDLLPSVTETDQVWISCKHENWQFLPWHRGYLYYFEQLLRHIIVTTDWGPALKPPANWTLPYWDYFSKNPDGRFIPPAFMDKHGPDGGINPLYVPYRFGIQKKNKPYEANPLPFISHSMDIDNTTINLSCLLEPWFYHEPIDNKTGFGGAYKGIRGAGKVSLLEGNPHGYIHVIIGGAQGNLQGLLSNPLTAALDPVFWLHHCNIDRLWEVWLSLPPSQGNPLDPEWLTPEEPMYMPNKDGQLIKFTTDEVKTTTGLNYQYDNLQLDVELPKKLEMHQELLLKRQDRLMEILKLDRPELKIMTTPVKSKSELLGGTTGFILNDAASTSSKTLNLHQPTLDKTLANFTHFKSMIFSDSPPTLPNQILLELNGIKCNFDATVLEVSLEISVDDNVQILQVANIPLFGVQQASQPAGPHGGVGLTTTLDITKQLDPYLITTTLPSSIKVKIASSNKDIKNFNLSIDSISLYRD